MWSASCATMACCTWTVCVCPYLVYVCRRAVSWQQCPAFPARCIAFALGVGTLQSSCCTVVFLQLWFHRLEQYWPMKALLLQLTRPMCDWAGAELLLNLYCVLLLQSLLVSPLCYKEYQPPVMLLEYLWSLEALALHLEKLTFPGLISIFSVLLELTLPWLNDVSST